MAVAGIAALKRTGAGVDTGAMVLCRVLLQAALLASALAQAQEPRQAELASCTVRSEFFVLEQPAAAREGEPGSPQPEPAASIAWRLGFVGGKVLVERDVQFREGGVRVLHDERSGLGPDGRGSRLVWRELRGGLAPGRSWIARVQSPIA